MTPTAQIYTVSEFNRIIQKSLEERFSAVWIEGEISNFRGVASSGHCYFSLKDENAQIDVVAFRGVMGSLKFKLEEGLKVLLSGKASIYPQRGRFQVIAYSIEPKGAGALQLAFEQLKKKLESEGLFDPSRKKPIPSLPRKIGIVTSPTGAAIRDILAVIDRRFANVEILIAPVKVQGEGAREEISEAIEFLNKNVPDLDVLLVGRGGGSIEDLWAFNEEAVARAIASSRIPVISCVGHEIDFTIADFVADLRAPTPSAAAELVVKDKMELRSALFGLLARLEQSVSSNLNAVSERLKGIARSSVFLRPQEDFEDRFQTVDYLREKMDHSMESVLQSATNKIGLLRSQVLLLSPRAVLEERSQFLKMLIERGIKAMVLKNQKRVDDLRSRAGQLEALSPLAVLSRGYSIAWSLPDHRVLKSSLQVAEEEWIRVKLHQGEIKAVVKERMLGEERHDEKRDRDRIEKRKI